MKQGPKAGLFLIHFTLKNLVINSVFRIRDALIQPGLFLSSAVELFPVHHHQVNVEEVRSALMEQRQKQTLFSVEESSLLSEEHTNVWRAAPDPLPQPHHQKAAGKLPFILVWFILLFYFNFFFLNLILF